VNLTAHSTETGIRNAISTRQLTTLGIYTASADTLPQVSPVMLVCTVWASLHIALVWTQVHTVSICAEEHQKD